MVTWQNVLMDIRKGGSEIPTTDSGIPLVAVNAPFYELMQLMEALTTGHNEQVSIIKEYERKIEQLRKIAGERFPASRAKEETK